MIEVIHREFFILKKRKTQRAKCSSRDAFRVPWMTRDLLCRIRFKNVLFRKFRFFGDKESESVYKKFRNHLNYILRDAKRKFFEGKIKASGNSTRNLWSTVNLLINKKGNRINNFENGILVNNQLITNKFDIAMAFNKYFSSVAIELQRMIPVVDTSLTNYFASLPLRQSSSFILSDINCDDLAEIFDDMRGTDSTDLMGFSNKLMKTLFGWIVRPLTYIINLSFRKGYFPVELGRACIIPLHKKGNKNVMSNYRPICKSSILSKIFEKAFLTKLRVYLVDNGVLCHEQFGFREGFSTDYAVLSFVQDAISDLDSGLNRISVMLDLAKAFDTIDHGILISKLEIYGIRLEALSWIRSFLNSRKHCVSIGGVNSDYCSLDFGVPQRSILAPILFLLYINDLPRVSSILKLGLFADDTVISYSFRNIGNAMGIFNDELNMIYRWLSFNKLSINHDKNRLISFRLAANTRLDLRDCLSFGGKPLIQCSNFKYLGITIDETLSWAPHLIELKRRLSRVLGIL